MKNNLITAGIASVLSLALAACDSGTNTENNTAMEQATAPAAPVSENSEPVASNQSDLNKTAKEWSEKTGELATEAWDATKETAADVGEKSKEYYETAKEKTADMTETVIERTKEYYEAGKEKAGDISDAVVDTSKDVYEAAKVKSSEMMSDSPEPATATDITEEAETAAEQMTLPKAAE